MDRFQYHPPTSHADEIRRGLGIPPEMMANPEAVGRRLASRIGSRKPFITLGLSDALGLFFMRHFPIGMGRFMAKMTQRGQQQEKK